MDFTFEKVKDLFNKGQFASICKTVGSDLSSLKLLPPDARVLIAHASVYAGRVQAATDFRSALRLAREERDTTQLAWAHAHLFRLIAVAGYPASHLTALLDDA